MTFFSLPAVTSMLLITAMPATPGRAAGQDQEPGQQGAVWNLGELPRGAYPSTITAQNQSCPGAHDFHISLEGDAAEFLVITGPTILTEIPPGASKISDVVVNLRNMAPGPHDDGAVLVKCVDCPPTCSQDYDRLAVRVTVADDGSAPLTATTAPPSVWDGIDLTTLDATRDTRALRAASAPQAGEASYRWMNPGDFPATTLVHDALAEGLVELEFDGTGLAAGYIFRVRITRRAETPFEIAFPLGTVLMPDDRAYSPMMLGDDGAVALLDEVTVVTVPGYSLDPALALAPGPESDSGDGPGWEILEAPDSGSMGAAVDIINSAYLLAGDFRSDMNADDHLQTVVQRAVWSVADVANFGKPRLRADIVAQVGAIGGSQDDEQAEELADALWHDVTAVINAGKQD